MAAAKKPVIVVEMRDTEPKKGSVKYLTEERPVDLTNIYLNKSGVQKLGNPAGVKVTIEALDA